MGGCDDGDCCQFLFGLLRKWLLLGGWVVVEFFPLLLLLLLVMIRARLGDEVTDELVDTLR